MSAKSTEPAGRATKRAKAASKSRFDCVEMKRRIQTRINADIEGLSPAQEIEYFRARVSGDPDMAAMLARIRGRGVAKRPVRRRSPPRPPAKAPRSSAT